MVDLAESLGHSVLFPVSCKYCGRPIFLFASPDGGFAVFDEVGPPWPKHRCTTRPQPAESHYSPPARSWGGLTLPVPSDCARRRPSEDRPIRGVVVHVEEEPAGGLFILDVFDGRGLDRVKVRRAYRVGVLVRGVARQVAGVGTILEEVSVVSPPPQQPDDAHEGERLDRSDPEEPHAGSEAGDR